MENLNVQYGISLSADFEENTYTFEMEDGFSVSSGEFAILPKEEFEMLINQLNNE